MAAVGSFGVLKFLTLAWREGYRAAVVSIVLLAAVGVVSEYLRQKGRH